MKIVITTQVRENYGAHDWNGIGTCPQYWKCKGGSTYVVSNLSVGQVLKIKEGGIPTLKALIECRSEAYEEFVADWSIIDDDAAICDPWETPFELFWEDGRWIARRTVENGEYGFMNRNVERKTEEFVMVVGGKTEDYRVVYIMRNGDVVKGEEVETYLKKAA